ncbi:MAG: hypothetical protein EXX96DRAFT_574242 [Benjaminiella poitrasii]|nr:MAG: hypothetical protein EXX96DRAFT_574242 [Benjaminiella poitrasii]
MGLLDIIKSFVPDGSEDAEHTQESIQTLEKLLDTKYDLFKAQILGKKSSNEDVGITHIIFEKKDFAVDISKDGGIGNNFGPVIDSLTSGWQGILKETLNLGAKAIFDNYNAGSKGEYSMKYGLTDLDTVEVIYTFMYGYKFESKRLRGYAENAFVSGVVKVGIDISRTPKHILFESISASVAGTPEEKKAQAERVYKLLTEKTQEGVKK